jgi:hypothetical protein
MHLGWKVVLPTALGYVVLVAGTVLTLDHLGLGWGLTYGLALTAVSLACTIGFLFFIDRDRVIAGASKTGKVQVASREIYAPTMGD